MRMKLEILLEAVDRMSGPLLRAQSQLAGLAGRVRSINATAAGFDRLAGAAARVGQATGQAAMRLGGVAGLAVAAGAGLNGFFIRGAAQFEDFEAMLETMTGSAEEARRRMAWVQDWARTTPYSLEESTRAFVTVFRRAQDVEGAMNAIGQAAAGNRVPLQQAAEAFNDAVMGEFERLKELGIAARQEGSRVVFEWSRAGRTFMLGARNNRSGIEHALRIAMNSAFPGAMARLATGWNGMMSNLGDAWQRFTLLVMRSGAFDWLKARLNALLDTLDRMERDGTLRRWAEATSIAFIRVFEAAEPFVVALPRRLSDMATRANDAFAALRRVLRPILGDFDALDAALVALASVTFGPLVTALTVLGAALLTTPAGLAITAIGAIAAAGLAIRENWWGIGDWFGQQMETMRAFGERALRSLVDGPINDFRAVAGALREAWEGVKGFFEDLFGGIERRARALVDVLRDLLPGGGGNGPLSDPEAQRERSGRMGRRGQNEGYYGPPVGERMGWFAPPLDALGFGRALTREARLSGEIEVRVTDERVAVRGRSRTPGVSVDVNQGVLAWA
jgi:hypothetical protein